MLAEKEWEGDRALCGARHPASQDSETNVACLRLANPACPGVVTVKQCVRSAWSLESSED